MSADELIRQLNLSPLPLEGGYYRETYRSATSVTADPDRNRRRSLATSIYYLLTAGTFSAMHRLPGDEVFHFYLGDPVEMLMLHPDGSGQIVLLGADVERMLLQHVVPGNTWQGSRLVSGGQWALMGTTMSPGFEFADYEAGTGELVDEYPRWGEEIVARMAGGKR